MKSRASFFNSTVYRKNLTRFAPAWALYGVLLLMILLTLTGLTPDGLDAELRYMLQLFPIANFLFALLAALLLFGDLYNSRMCNALHALPLRREGWFFTNLASGMTFSLIPTLAALIFCLLVTGLMGCEFENGMIVPLLVFLGANLQYLFFFGLAVLSAFLVGSRFALAVVYGILNFGSLITYWLVDTLYTPMLYGVKTVFDPFMLFSPVVQMCGFTYIDVNWATPETVLFADRFDTVAIGTVYLSDGWGYLAVCAVIGIAMMGLALLLYKKRKLECAGDFMAVKGMEPVFLVVYTLFAGALFQLFFGLFNGNDIDIFLFIGLMVGFFTGRMLLKRTVRVFQWKAWAMCDGLIVVFVLTLLVTFLDPFGIQRWVPEANEVKSVTVYANHNEYASQGSFFTVEDPEDIENIIQVHELALVSEPKQNISVTTTETASIVVDGVIQPTDGYYTFTVGLSYKMKNGTTVRRYYYVWTNGEAGQILEEYFSSVECILGAPEEELEALAERVEYVYVEGTQYTADYLGLLQAMAADCKEGSMTQVWAYRRGNSDTAALSYVEFNLRSGYGNEWFHIQISNRCTNTINWLEKHNISLPDYDEKYG